MATRTELYTFRTVFVQNKDLVCFAAQIDELAEAGSDASCLMRVVPSTSSWGAINMDWGAVRAASGPQPPICILGVGGEVLEAVPGAGSTESVIDDGPEGPEFRGPMRDLRWIGNHLYAAGMARQVYRREGPGKWSRADAGTVLKLGTKTAAGFNSIDGLTEDDIYGVGFGGEIWRRQRGKWKKLDSPTNVILTRVRVVKPDLVYAVGQQGVLLQGSGDTWKVIDHHKTDDDFWGLEWFKDRLYIASETYLYRLTSTGTLEEVDTGDSEDSYTYYDLHANDGVLWSVGPKTLLWTDGKKWHEVD